MFRVDNYDEAVNSMFTLAGSVLKYASSYMLQPPSTPSAGNKSHRVACTNKYKLYEYLYKFVPRYVYEIPNRL